MRKREFEPAVHHGFLCTAMPKLEQGVGEQRKRRPISQDRGRGPGCRRKMLPMGLETIEKEHACISIYGELQKT